MDKQEYKDRKYELQCVINWLSKYETKIRVLTELGWVWMKPLYEMAKEEQHNLFYKFKEAK